MPSFPLFVGPSNRQASITVDAARTVNLYARAVTEGAPKARFAFYKRGGLSPFGYLGAGPVRGLFAQDGRAFGVGGAYVYEILPSGNTITQGGPIKTNGNPATISSSGASGDQLFITSGGEGYSFTLSTDTFANITDPQFPSECVMGLFFKTYFWALSGADGRVQASKAYDCRDWNAVDFVKESDVSDKTIALSRTHDNLWLMGSRNTAPWAYTGAGNQSIEPIPGSLIEHGTGAPFSAVELDNTLYWLGRDEFGSAIVWRAQGYTPVRISTHAVEYALSRVSDFSQAVAFGYQEQGHTFYVLYVPGLETSWVYDISTEQWAERGHWKPSIGQYIPYRPIFHCYAFGKHLVGDRLSGAVYEQSMDLLTDSLVVA